MAVLSGLAMAAETLPAPSISLAEAVEATLAQQPGVQVTREEVKLREGDVQSAAGRFDWVAGTFYSDEVLKTPTGASFPFPEERRQDISVYGVGVTKQLRSGITIAPQVQVVDAKDSISNPAPVSQSSLSLTVTVPLLRGLGTKATGAQEKAAKVALEGQQQLARYRLDQIVFDTTQAYWNCLAARRYRDILKDNASRAERIYDVVDKLARGGEVDGAQRDQVRALVASRRAISEDGELNYYSARQVLALALGLKAAQLEAAPEATGEFPVTVAPDVIRPAVNEKYVAEAFDRRGDFLALKLGVDAQEILLAQAKSNLKPRLDFSLKVGYAGDDRRADRWRPAYSVSNDLAGVNALGSVTLEWPMANSLARGALVSQRAQTELARLDVASAENAIASSVLVYLETLRKTITQYELSSQAVETYRKTVAQTNEKMSSGEATLTELIDVEDRYADARRGQIESLRKYAITLAQLRLVTGTLSNTSGQNAVFEVSTLTTVPFTP